MQPQCCTDCTLTTTMFLSHGVHRAQINIVLAASISAGLSLGYATQGFAQQSSNVKVPASEPQLVAQPLPEDRGEAKLEQTLKQLGTTASLMTIVAHPDDEDGAMLTSMSRG